MCLVRVKEDEEYTVPARVVRSRRVVRERSLSPIRSTRVSRTIVEERRPSPRSSYSVIPPPAPPVSIPAPQPIPIFIEPPPSLPPLQSRAPSRAPSVRAPSRAPSRTRSHYVEVEGSVTSSSSSSSEDVRSKTTHKTSKSHRTSKPATTAPGSEYYIREKEYRRERARSRPQEEYETFRYIEAPPDGDRSRDRRSGAGGGRNSFNDENPRGSRTSYRRERERVVVVDDEGQRRREYRR